MIEKVLSPRVREARTNSRSFSRRVWARVTRLMPIHSEITRATVMLVRPGFITTIRSVTITVVGIVERISTIRWRKKSSFPP